MPIFFLSWPILLIIATDYCTVSCTNHSIDLTTEFKEFTSAIDRKARNLYEVLFYKNEILGNLLKGLTIDSTSQNGRAKTIAFDSFLILLSALVMDLQQEMLPDMHQIFNCISQIVTIPKLDPNVLKAAFQTIACIFKYLAQDFSTDPVMAFKYVQLQSFV